MNGKGSDQRPCDKDRFNREFDRIFGMKDTARRSDDNTGFKRPTNEGQKHEND